MDHRLACRFLFFFSRAQFSILIFIEPYRTQIGIVLRLYHIADKNGKLSVFFGSLFLQKN